MSKKTQNTKATRKPVPAAWQSFETEIMGESTKLVSRMPANRRVVLAKPGMVCMPSGSIGYARIEVLTPEICIVRFESGRAEAYFWGEIELAAVQPHPRYLSGRGKR